jgi:hypothetical protein
MASRMIDDGGAGGALGGGELRSAIAANYVAYAELVECQGPGGIVIFL